MAKWAELNSRVQGCEWSDECDAGSAVTTDAGGVEADLCEGGG